MPDINYQDDASIPDDSLLLRRILSNPNIHIVWDDNLRCWRPSSAAFDNDRNGNTMSVVLSVELVRLNRPLESSLKGHEDGFSLAAVTAGFSRNLNQVQKIVRDPTPDEPAHGLLVGKKTQSVRRKLAKNSQWIVEPDLPEPL